MRIIPPPSLSHMCRDLSIKHVFDTHPILWQCLRIIADPPSSHTTTTNEPSALITCAPILRSLLTVLTQHWQRCCVDNTDMFSRELRHSVALIECIAMVSGGSCGGGGGGYFYKLCAGIGLDFYSHLTAPNNCKWGHPKRLTFEQAKNPP